MFAFLLGTFFGAGVVLFVIYLIIVDPWSPKLPSLPFIDQFKPIEIPKELRDFLKTGDDGEGISKWESCHSFSLFLHMFYQEHKDTRLLRRWIHKRLQMELNDISTRTTAGRLIQEIRIRDLSLGTKFPNVNAIRVERVEVSEDKNIFQNITFLIDMDYTGGFETSIDVTTVFGKKANLSIKITKLAGLVRFILSRQPYNYWTFSFVSAPAFETDISSQIQGHQLKRLIPLIKESIRRALQRKHVWPNYKIRYRPVFPNPLLQASPPLSSFAHVKLEGGLEVTVLQCSRLQTALVEKDIANYEVYCTITMDLRPFLHNSTNLSHSLSVMLTFSRYHLSSAIGITFEKTISAENGIRPVRVASVESGSLAEKAAFKPGDTLVAINNVPIRSERQVVRFLQQTIGDLFVLVDRSLDNIDDNDLKDLDEFIEDLCGNSDEAFVPIETVEPQLTKEGCSLLEPHRRHSMSNIPFDQSVLDAHTESINSSLMSLDGHFNRPSQTVFRTKSARVPHVLVTQPNMDLRRTRSESQIDLKGIGSMSINNSEVSADLDEEIGSIMHFNSLDVLPQKNLNAKGVNQKNISTSSDCRLRRTEGSSSSLMSTGSFKTDVTEEADEDEGRFIRYRGIHSRKQRLQATFQAGKRKVLDFMPQKKRCISPFVIDSGEVCIDSDIGSLCADRSTNFRSPLSTKSIKITPTETHVMDKKDKHKDKSRSSRINQHKSSPNLLNDSPTSSITHSRSRTTKSVHFRENVLWGQSVHFKLDASSYSSLNKNSCKYLNVTIHAKEWNSNSESQKNSSTTEPSRPILLGYTSLYIPQLIDDCQLTLSNRHREVFPLKPPVGVQLINNNIGSNAEFSRHAGFDPRLCFGDITLGFRYFPSGLPHGAGLNSGDESEEEIHQDFDKGRSYSPPIIGSLCHEWKPWNSKSGNSPCGMCRGKIWLKSASCCQRCLVVCHHKCVEKANNGITCTPHRISENDCNFEELDVDLNSAMVDMDDDVPITVIPSTPQSTTPFRGDSSEPISRRTRLKNKMSEKLSYWRRGGRKKDDNEGDSSSRNSESNHESTIDSPMASIQDCLADVLPSLSGSPFIHSLYFQPGNAYNEQTINHAKNLGKEIFTELQGEERKKRINDEIDRIHIAIRETKDGRLAAMKNETDLKGFEGLDERLQALAVLMLHYCAALQDCEARNRSSSMISVKDNIKSSLNTQSEQITSIMDIPVTASIQSSQPADFCFEDSPSIYEDDETIVEQERFQNDLNLAFLENESEKPDYKLE